MLTFINMDNIIVRFPVIVLHLLSIKSLYAETLVKNEPTPGRLPLTTPTTMSLQTKGPPESPCNKMIKS